MATQRYHAGFQKKSQKQFKNVIKDAILVARATRVRIRARHTISYTLNSFLMGSNRQSTHSRES